MDANSAACSTNSSATNAAFDQPYRFGRRPTVRAPFPFTERQFARLLIMRSRIQDAPAATDQLEAA